MGQRLDLAVLTGNPSDDTFALSAGTGQKLSLSAGGSGLPAPQFTSNQTGTVNGTANTFAPLDLSSVNGIYNLPNAPADGTVSGFKVESYSAPQTLTVNAQGADTMDGGGTSATPALVLGLVKLWRYASATKVWTPLVGDTPVSQLDKRYTQMGVYGPGSPPTPGAVSGASQIIPDPIAKAFGLYWATMNAATPAFTLATPTLAGARIMIRLDQDATGGRVPSFAAASGSVLYPAGAPNFTGAQAAAGARSFISAIWDGTNWFLFPDTTGLVFMFNPMTTANDLIIGGSSGTPTRLATSASKVLSTDASGNIIWAAGGGGLSSGQVYGAWTTAQIPWAPSGAKVENIMRREFLDASLNPLSSGRLSLFGGAVIPAGVTISNITFYASATGAGPYEVDSLSVSGATSGTITVSFTWNGNAYTSGTIAFNATAATVQTALLAATRTGGIAFSADAGATALACTGGALNTSAVTVTFQNNANGPVTAQSVNTGSLTGGTASFTRTTNGSLPTHQWFCLVDQNLNVIRLTTDDLGNPWGAGNAKTLAIATDGTGAANTSYTPANDIAVYIGCMVAANTPPTLHGLSLSTVAGQPHALAPILSATSTTGLTTPASLGATAGALTYTASLAYSILT